MAEVMRAVVAQKAGGPEVLQVVSRAVPEPAPGEVLVKVIAAGVNRADAMQRAGDYQPPDGQPVLGLEVSGTVVALGPGTTAPAVGSQVVALVGSGGYAEFVAAPAGQTAPLPQGVDPVDAGGIIEVAATVWSNLVMVAGLRAGERVLVHGGASGIGTMAVQVARHLGARVAATVGSPAKVDLVHSLGAELVVDYRAQDFVEALGTADFVPDVILDVVGGAYLRRNVRVLATRGRLVVIGLQGGREGPMPIGELLYKQGSLYSTSLRARPVEHKTEIVQSTVDGIWPAMTSGAIEPVVVSGRHRLDDVRAAHRALEHPDHVGKEILVVDS